MTLLLLTGGGVQAPPPDPTLDTLRTAASGTRYARLSGNQPSVDTTFQAEYTMEATATDLQLVYSFPDSTGTGTLTLAAAVEVGGTLYPLTFSGAARVALTYGGTRWATSDVLGVTITKGTKFRVRSFATAGSSIMQGAYAQMAPTTETPGDLTVAGSGPLTINPGVARYIVGPVAVRGKTAAATVAVGGFGDSILEGGNDLTVAEGGGGFFYRATTGAGVPAINWGKWADNFPAISDQRFGGNNLDYITHGVCEYGTNQMAASGGNWTVIASSAITFWTAVAAKGIKLWQTTLIPKTSSTDLWATLGNQTLDPNEAARTGFNDWLRDGAPTVAGAAVAVGTSGALRAGDTGHPLKGYLEIADTVESTRNSGKWKVTGANNWPTSDGTHPAPASHALMAAPLQTWAAALTA